MLETLLRVKYLSLKSCFLYFSPAHADISTGSHVKVLFDDKIAYFSAGILNSLDAESLGINSMFAKAIGFKEKQYVSVSQIEQLPVVNSFNITPVNKSDYDVLEMLAQNVQSGLLDQVRVVNSSQNLIIWIGNNISVAVFVDNVRPISPGMIDFLTEVQVNIPEEKSKVKDNPVNFETHLQHIKNFRELIEQRALNYSDKSANILDHCDINNAECVLRIIPLNELPDIKEKLKSFQPFTIFISKMGPYKELLNTNRESFYSVRLLNNPYEMKTVYVKLTALEDILNNEADESVTLNAYAPNLILNILKCDFGDRVLCEKLVNKPYVTTINVHFKKNFFINVLEKLKFYLADNSQEPLILNSNVPLEIDKNLYCHLKFVPESEFCVVDDDFLRNCSYTVCNEEIKFLEQITKPLKSPDSFLFGFSPFKSAWESVKEIIIQKGKFCHENIIITGRPGMGKTVLLELISQALKKDPHFIYTEYISCKKLKGKIVDSVQKYFAEAFSKLIFCQPSVIILDDLQVLCERCEDEETPNSVYYNRVSEMLNNLFVHETNHNCIGIIASVRSITGINKHIYKSRGNHLFKNVITLAELTKNDREVLIKHHFQDYVVQDLDYSELAIKTDGFVVHDVADFCNKVIFEACKGELDVQKEPIIKHQHSEIALKKSCALSLQNVKFTSPKSKNFADIGGLHSIKHVLIENLLWPVQYPSIFSDAPLRLQSGLLLYGAPGTGKTLLAGAAAKQCNLRLISVKGPELLSKYIGASEQAVRDVFEKAQRAKPCILFFDEFDSLAPRRGHDNTGVTDRVVNQFLTHLDGIESLTGVCVLAATSRPDLLDPALLRPGRLDRQLLCPMPDKETRLEILNILSIGLEFDDSVDLEQIAIVTQGYSGADLQSLLYTCQLSLFPDINDNDMLKGAGRISQKCLLEALNKTRPSLSRTERMQYDIIYKKFQGGMVDDFKAGSKVTLA